MSHLKIIKKRLKHHLVELIFIIILVTIVLFIIYLL